MGTTFFLDSINTGMGPSVKFAGANVVAGNFFGWTPIGAEQTASGYQIAWKLTGVDQYAVWNADSNGNYVSDAIDHVSGASTALQSFDQFPSGLEQRRSNRRSRDGTGTVIESAGSTSLVVVGTTFFLDSISTGMGPSVKFAGAEVVAGNFFGWTPIGAEQTASGYQIAWRSRALIYMRSGTPTATATTYRMLSTVSGASTALQSFETSFHQDLNSDGAIGVPGTVMEWPAGPAWSWSGATFFLDSISTGMGPSVDAGAEVVAGNFFGWTPIGAEQTASGYQIAWKLTGVDQYAVWNADSNGNYVTDAIDQCVRSRARRCNGSRPVSIRT